MKDFIAWTKANPDKTNYASTSAAFTLTSELFKLKTGTPPASPFAFNSGNDSVMSVVSNQVTYAIRRAAADRAADSASGNARALAVAVAGSACLSCPTCRPCRRAAST